ncbi:PREDICTED: uncharacterized protein LOC109129497 [Camelina sativa]|uniref:Uncharacterized protein LOC109129497 n=1 Tax=Camelina sativa TaxID=90675 RepID=A0ABM1R2R7_CAMSA|nr:PREDICTED: uncharacterized protein LOC109129497 [Camelina sativa]
MGIFKEGGAGAYLGMPECFSGSKVHLLSDIKDRVKALAMHVFLMTCFKLPKTSCSNLASVMADFWGNNVEHSNKIHWLQSWEKLCLPKDQGGMGFRDIGTFNQAFLSKQAWRILHFPDCLFAKVMKGKYFPSSDFLNQNWELAYPLLGEAFCMEGFTGERPKKNIGNGKSIRVWMDNWIEDGEIMPMEEK